MRCADCGLYECALRSPLGGCPNGEAVEQAVIFTAPDTKPYDLGVKFLDVSQSSSLKEFKAMTYMADHSYNIVVLAEICKAASDLVDAVERYMRQECLRSELAMRKDKLKALLK